MAWIEGPPRTDCTMELIEVPYGMRPVPADKCAEIWGEQVTPDNRQVQEDPLIENNPDNN